MENQWTVVNRAKLIPKHFPCFRNNGTTYYVCEHNQSGLLKSEGDISAGLFMCYFIKLKEFATKQHRMANSVHF